MKVPLILATPEDVIAFAPFDAVIVQPVQVNCPLPLLIPTPVDPAFIAEFMQVILPVEFDKIP
ncbi:MAG: hypothetical protein EBY29_07710 [Planctomycetes bacterium]|nr:hypothetical protein [Planctomycetota bacterium]